MLGDWLYACTYMVHWIPPFPRRWEIRFHMIGSHLYRFMGAALWDHHRIQYEARWWIIAHLDFWDTVGLSEQQELWYVTYVYDFAANQSTWSCRKLCSFVSLICLAMSGRLPLPTPLRHLVWEPGCWTAKRGSIQLHLLSQLSWSTAQGILSCSV